MIGTPFGALTFLHPWILTGLLFLPALWFLLRVTPPAPRRIFFPPAHILAGLTPKDRTPKQTPWWILLLRLLAAALVIMALAGPVLNPGSALPGAGGIRLVMDNSWAGAQNWALQTAEADALLKRAGRENREIHVMTTAPQAGKAAPLLHGPLTVAQAESLLRGLSPQPWPADYTAMETALRDARPRNGLHSYWLGHGLAEGDPAAVIRALQGQGGLTYRRPAASQLPLLLRPPAAGATALAARIDAPAQNAPPFPVTAQAIAGDGRLLDSLAVMIDPAKLPQVISFDIPESLRAQVAMIRLAGRDSAGTVLLTDDRFRNRTIGIVTPDNVDETAPLTEASHYIRQAFGNAAHVLAGPVLNLLDSDISILVMPDVGALPPGTLDALEKWVRAGGMLLRFAGPNMTQGEQFLTPVPLRGGGRALDGALTWEKPVKLAPFPDSSPFYGLPVTEDIIVNRQILAEPVAGIEQMTWAVLEDGTPLITAAPRDKGLLVMVHTTATPLWSDLVLSGTFVKMMQRIVTISPGSAGQGRATGALQPLWTLSGRGVLESPGAHVKPLPAEMPAAGLIPDSAHPPGIYGRAGIQTVFNLGDHIARPQIMPPFPAGVTDTIYGASAERDIAPALLLAALFLFAFDWLLMIVMQNGFLRLPARRAAFVVILACVGMGMVMISPAMAEDSRAQDSRAQNNGTQDGAARDRNITPAMIEYAASLHLAYIRSGDNAIDNNAAAGLKVLADTLAARTSVEPTGVVGLDLSRDELSFFPFIYWPVAAGGIVPDDKALHRIQHYIDHGGLILIDTRDRLSGTGNESGGGRNAAALRALLGGLDIPPLKQIDDDHVLKKSFYLLSAWPGRYDGGVLWVEEPGATGRDNVSAVIIGSHDWAAAWAAGAQGGTRLSGGARQQELALRFGVNAVMYALTGNYKADQVHIPHILERLGQ